MAGTPDQIAQRWAAGLAGAGDKIRSGVEAVTVSPGQAAARQKNVYLANVQASADKWARNTGAVTLADWKQSMTEKGISRIGAGATASQPKFANFMGKLLPYVASGRQSLPARGTFEQNKARASAWIDYMHKFSAK